MSIISFFAAKITASKLARTNLSEIQIKILTSFSFKKMPLKLTCAERRPFCRANQCAKIWKSQTLYNFCYGYQDTCRYDISFYTN